MLYLVFKKIDKSKYPKVARKWAWSVLLIFPTFVIANKLWPFLYLYLILNFINLLLVVFRASTIIIDVVSFIFYIIIAFYTFFLVLYGRTLAWQKLGYRDTGEDIAKFKLRQRIVAYINIFLIGLMIIYIVYVLSMAHINAVL